MESYELRADFRLAFQILVFGFAYFGHQENFASREAASERSPWRKPGVARCRWASV
jgi:hypothetical protein